MAFKWLDLPPGVYHNGTQLQSSGRYWDADLVRFPNKTLRPMGGWQERLAGQIVTGAPRAAKAWRDNSGGIWLGIGTHSGLFVQSASGGVSDITPVGLTAGHADATINTGYGAGPYGSYTYGTARPSLGDIVPATVWSVDNFGEDLVGCSDADGRLYEWKLNVALRAAVITNAPTNCQGLFVTNEGFLVALGASGDPRLVQWSDQRNDTVWTPSDTNQAGSLDLQTSGEVMCGRAMRNLSLVLTSTDAWAMSYLGFPLVYGFERLGTGCGPASKGAIAATDSQAMWMGFDNFWLYNGYIQQMPCDVYDQVFSNINRAQISKVSCVHLAAFGEAIWFYPSANSNENDRYVMVDYLQGVWNFGYSMPRLCGVDKGVFANPIMVDAGGKIYAHENGFSYGGAVPFAESGPVISGNGDRMIEITSLISDDQTLGDTTITLFGRNFPDDTDVTYGPLALTGNTSILAQAGQFRVRFNFVGADDARVGRLRYDATQGDPLF